MDPITQVKIEQLENAGMKLVRPRGNNYFDGLIDGVQFQVQMFDEGSSFGIDGTRLSRIFYKRSNKDGWTCLYDRGFDQVVHSVSILASVDGLLYGIRHELDADPQDVPSYNKWNDEIQCKLLETI